MVSEHFPTGEKDDSFRERIREDAFSRIIQREVIENFKDALAEAGFSLEQEHEFESAFAPLSEKAKSGVLSLPFSLREIRLKRFHERIEKGELTVEGMVKQLADEAAERHFCLGYHVSKADILPKQGKKGEVSWGVDGKEADHRDNDITMAYYSTSLATLYGKKHSKYLYVVRSEKGPNTTHRQDNDGSWGRAPKLDIVAKFDLEQVMKEVRDVANGEKKE